MKAISFLGLLNMLKVLMKLRDTLGFDGRSKIVCVDVVSEQFYKIFSLVKLR
jgi:hypothetical protein